MRKFSIIVAIAATVVLQLPAAAAAQSSIITPKVAPYPGQAPAVGDFAAACPAASAADLQALSKFVFTLQSQGIWSRMIAVYPFVGASLSCFKYNLKNVADTDAAYRLVFWFNGTNPTASGAGITFNGQSANTFFVQSASGFGHDISFGARISSGFPTFAAVMGAVGPAGDARNVITYDGSGVWRAAFSGNNATSTGGFPNQGFMSASHSGSNAVLYQNGGQIAFTIYSGNLTGWPFAINGFANGGSLFGSLTAASSSTTYTFAYIGQALNDTQMNNLATAVNTLQVDLGGR